MAEAGQGLLAQLLGDGVDGDVGSCLEDERGVTHELGTLGGTRRVRGRRCGIRAAVNVAGKVGRSAEGDQQTAEIDIGDRRRVERQRSPIEPDTLFVGEAPYGLVSGEDGPLAGGCPFAVGGQLDPVPGDVGEVLGEVGGEVGLRHLGDGAVQPGSVGGRERRLDRVPGERMDEPVVADIADPVEQAVSDRLVDEREALSDGSIEYIGNERNRKVSPDDRRGLDEPTAGGRDTVDPGADDVEHRARRPVRTPCAVGERPGDFANEQRVAPGDIEDGASVCCHLTPGEPRQLLAHLGQAVPMQIETLRPR